MKAKSSPRKLKSLSLERGIVVKDEKWRWEIQKNNIKFLSPEQKFYMMKIWDFVDMTQEEFVEANRKKLIRITPRVIREYIEEVLMK
jgi:hypothetical protein